MSDELVKLTESNKKLAEQLGTLESTLKTVQTKYTTLEKEYEEYKVDVEMDRELFSFGIADESLRKFTKYSYAQEAAVDGVKPDLKSWLPKFKEANSVLFPVTKEVKEASKPVAKDKPRAQTDNDVATPKVQAARVTPQQIAKMSKEEFKMYKESLTKKTV